LFLFAEILYLSNLISQFVILRVQISNRVNYLELIFSMLGEASTTKVTRAKNAKGFIENKKAAKIGGKIAGNALKELEKESRENVITSENYLLETKKFKELKRR